MRLLKEQHRLAALFVHTESHFSDSAQAKGGEELLVDWSVATVQRETFEGENSQIGENTIFADKNFRRLLAIAVNAEKR